MEKGSTPARDVPSGEAIDENWLFVYGTLKRGGGKDRMMAGCTWNRPATVAGSLYDIGEFPALVLDRGGTVRGELWACPAETLHRLDAYEGVPIGLFRRVRIVAGDRRCWTYVAGPALESRLIASARIPDGAWPRGREGKGD